MYQSIYGLDRAALSRTTCDIARDPYCKFGATVKRSAEVRPFARDAVQPQWMKKNEHPATFESHLNHMMTTPEMVNREHNEQLRRETDNAYNRSGKYHDYDRVHTIF